MAWTNALNSWTVTGKRPSSIPCPTGGPIGRVGREAETGVAEAAEGFGGGDFVGKRDGGGCGSIFKEIRHCQDLVAVAGTADPVAVGDEIRFHIVEHRAGGGAAVSIEDAADETVDRFRAGLAERTRGEELEVGAVAVGADGGIVDRAEVFDNPGVEFGTLLGEHDTCVGHAKAGGEDGGGCQELVEFGVGTEQVVQAVRVGAVVMDIIVDVVMGEREDFAGREAADGAAGGGEDPGFGVGFSDLGGGRGGGVINGDDVRRQTAEKGGLAGALRADEGDALVGEGEIDRDGLQLVAVLGPRAGGTKREEEFGLGVGYHVGDDSRCSSIMWRFGGVCRRAGNPAKTVCFLP